MRTELGRINMHPSKIFFARQADLVGLFIGNANVKHTPRCRQRQMALLLLFIFIVNTHTYTHVHTTPGHFGQRLAGFDVTNVFKNPLTHS